MLSCLQGILPLYWSSVDRVKVSKWRSQVGQSCEREENLFARDSKLNNVYLHLLIIYLWEVLQIHKSHGCVTLTSIEFWELGYHRIMDCRRTRNVQVQAPDKFPICDER